MLTLCTIAYYLTNLYIKEVTLKLQLYKNKLFQTVIICILFVIKEIL